MEIEEIIELVTALKQAAEVGPINFEWTLYQRYAVKPEMTPEQAYEIKSAFYAGMMALQKVSSLLHHISDEEVERVVQKIDAELDAFREEKIAMLEAKREVKQ
jgi:hypothetical protein